MAFLKVKNRAISTLASGISDSDLSLTVATGEGALFPTTGDFHLSLDTMALREIVKCTSRSDDVCTIVRAQEGTAAAAHTAGKAVKLQITAAIIAELQAHDPLTTGVHGVGENHVALAPATSHLVRGFTKGWTSGKLLKGGGVDADPTEVVGNKITLEVTTDALFSEDAMGTTPFTGKINGAPSGTSVTYDTDTGENSLTRYIVAIGKMVLHNLTRGNSRLIEIANISTNVITTQSSTDDWADNDDITTQSQVNTQAGYVDLDLSALLAATVTGIFVLVFFYDSGAAGQVFRVHPYEAYNIQKAIPLWNKSTAMRDSLFTVLPVVSQRITMLVTSSGTNTALPSIKYFGKLEDA